MRSLTLTTLFTTIALVGSQTIDPSTVSKSLRTTWCQNQRTTCPLLCLQQTGTAATVANDCNVDTLDWHCVCTDGRSPNVSEYSLTIPFHVCQEWGNQCVLKCGQNNACSDNCRTTYQCGAQNPTPQNTSTLTSTASKTSSSSSSTGTGGTFNTFGGSGSSGNKSGADVLAIGQSFGMGAVLAGVAAGMAFLL